MQRYFPRLFSFFVPVVWASEAMAYGTLAPDEFHSTSLLLWFDLLTYLLSVYLLNAFLMLLTYGIRKFALKKRTTTWADVCWPAALANLLLLGGVVVFFITAIKDVSVKFGAELPAPTLFIMAIPSALWFLPFVAALIFKGIERQPRLNIWLPIQLASLFLISILH